MNSEQRGNFIESVDLSMQSVFRQGSILQFVNGVRAEQAGYNSSVPAACGRHAIELLFDAEAVKLICEEKRDLLFSIAAAHITNETTFKTLAIFAGSLLHKIMESDLTRHAQTVELDLEQPLKRHSDQVVFPPDNPGITNPLDQFYIPSQKLEEAGGNGRATALKVFALSLGVGIPNMDRDEAERLQSVKKTTGPNGELFAEVLTSIKGVTMNFEYTKDVFFPTRRYLEVQPIE